MITTKKAKRIREAIDFGKFVAQQEQDFGTLTVMQWATTIGFNHFQRKVAVDVYHRNR